MIPTVLIADDSDLDLELTTRAIRKALAEVETLAVSAGDAVLEHFRLGVRPSLVLLDFRMPGMGAEEVLANLEPGLADVVPIILFSSSVSPSDVQKCVNLGARVYVEKPTDPDDYRNEIARLCREWIPTQG
jgi:CheY-like chemotaxis protein